MQVYCLLVCKYFIILKHLKGLSVAKTWGQFWLKTPNNKKWLKTVLVSLLFWWAEWRRFLKCGFGLHVFQSHYPVGSRCFYIYVCLATSVQLYVKAAVRVVSWQTVLQCQFWLLFLTGLMRSSARTAGNCPVTALYTRSSCASCCLQTQL